MHAISPAPLQVTRQEKLTEQLLLSQLRQSHAAPLSQNRSQNGLAVIKICGLQCDTFIARDTESLGGDDLTDAHGYPIKGAHGGYADKTDHPEIGEVPHGHS
jgi:hypothetical protein